jgi:hypothetical protein
MAWSDDFRVASFISLLGAPRARLYRMSADDASPLRAQARALALDAILWLEFGVRIGYWEERTATLALVELTPAFEGIYDWLHGFSRVLPEGPVDDVLRVRSEGVGESHRRFELGEEAAAAAGLHFRNAMAFAGRYTGRGQGAFSALAANLMFATAEEWSVVLARIDVERFQKEAGDVGPIADAIGLLRYMEGTLTVANAAARDSRFNELESQRISNELLSLMAWCLNLGDATTRARFDEFFEKIVAAMREDIEISEAEPRVRGEITNLAETWRAITHHVSEWETAPR